MNTLEFKKWRQFFHHQGVIARPLIMGILNITPDSFSDGNCYLKVDNALRRVEQMIAEGVDIIDVGGESSRPGALPVSVTEELDRLMPVIERIRSQFDICLSVDTTKATVMRAAIQAGVELINDVSALAEPEALACAIEFNKPVCLMHMQNTPLNMQNNPCYNNIIAEINTFFSIQIARCLQQGLTIENIIIDPGFGFGKTLAHNLSLINHIAAFKEHKVPLLLGASRKQSIGVLLNKPPEKRMIGSLILHSIAILNGLGLIRTHDIRETKEALIILQALKEARDTMII